MKESRICLNMRARKTFRKVLKLLLKVMFLKGFIYLLLLRWTNRFYYNTFPQDDINAMELEDDKRDLISREISKFRDTHKVTQSFCPPFSLFFS